MNAAFITLSGGLAAGLIGIIIFKKIHSIYKDKTKDVITILAPIGGGLVFIVFGLIYILG